MSNLVHLKSSAMAISLLGVAVALPLAGCDPKTPPPPTADAAAQSAQQADLLAREAAVAQKEADLAAKEAEALARQEADKAEQAKLAAAEQAAAAEKEAAAAKKAAAKKAAAAGARPTQPAKHTDTSPAKPAPVVAAPIQVPSGTQLTVELLADMSSKTAQAGDTFEGRVVSDVVVGDRVAVPAGSTVTGSVTSVVSGSRAIGAVPMVGLKFDRLLLANGQSIPISGDLTEQGASEKGRDTAKILGGAAAGAVLGHQVKKNDSGKVIGGILGGAIGAIAAKKTGTEVTLPAGSNLTIALGESFTVKP